MSVLSVNSISKSYADIKAIDALDLEVQAGEIWGILGPNGSGKTTLLGMLLGIIHPDAGNYRWFEGKYGKYERRYLGALLETPNFYPYLNADENLAIIRHIKNSQENNFDSLLNLVSLIDRRSSKFVAYSLGMRQRLAIAAAMVGNPEVLILDEPTNGLDPEGIADVRSTILDIAHNGKTIIMASHMLDEVQKICTHVAILRKGKLLAKGPVDAILSGKIALELHADDLDQLRVILSKMFNHSDIRIKENGIEVLTEPGYNTAQLNRSLMQEGIFLSQLIVKKHSLETEFLQIIKGH